MPPSPALVALPLRPPPPVLPAGVRPRIARGVDGAGVQAIAAPRVRVDLDDGMNERATGRAGYSWAHMQKAGYR